MTDQEIIVVVQTHAEGKKIESRLKNRTDRPWVVCSPIWDFNNYEYRVAVPVPAELWVNLYSTTTVANACVHDSRESADRAAQENRISCHRYVLAPE